MRAMGKHSMASFVTVVLNVSLGLLALALVLTIGLLVFSPFIKGPIEVDARWLVVGTRMTIPVSLAVDPGAHRVAAPSLGIQDAQLLNLRGDLRFPTAPGSAFFLGNAALLIAILVVALVVVGQLRAVFRTLRDGKPFVPANAARLRWVASGVIAFEIMRAGIVYFENYYAMTRFSAEGLRFEARLDLDVFAIVLALIVLVIAEVFRAGTTLDEDRSLTI